MVFRPKRSAADAIERCFVVLAQRSSAQWILEGDIKGCFDNISHDWMLRHLWILAQWLEAGFLEKGQLFSTVAGTPQGGLCSAEHNPPYEQCWIMHSTCL
ncbi:TPA: reverse transcriptase domain-containing protein [Salmonella enterica subsp. enterica serovar Muenchen]